MEAPAPVTTPPPALPPDLESEATISALPPADSTIFGMPLPPGTPAPGAEPTPEAPDAAAPPPIAAPVVEKGQLALILPLESPAFGRAAEAVREGFLAAYVLKPPGKLPRLAVYPHGHAVQDILNAYTQALQAGSRVIVGPLTRDGVSALAASGLISVPTLALNVPEADIPIPKHLYLFGLRVESDARQIARLAFAPESSRAYVLYGETQLETRISQAFVEAWRKLGGSIVAATRFDPDPSSLLKLKAATDPVKTDLVFLALNHQKARLARPYLQPNIPTYATSQVNAGRATALSNHDLNGVRLVDMPWMIAPDAPDVAAYPRPEGMASADLERLYAFGIDALKLAELLLDGPPAGTLALKGVTGEIRLDGAHRFERELLPGAIRQGEAAALDAAPR
jgi:outer membrane PBP1 activator LpoA protein